jgi:hypothetical protein
MKPAARTERPPRRSYHFFRGYQRSRAPSLLFRDAPATVLDFDSACWIETARYGAIGIRSIADHRAELDE